MYPELFRIGDFPVTTYGLWLAVRMLLALFAASRLAARDGLKKDHIYDLGLWTLIGGLVGSKVLMLLVDDHVTVFSLDFLRSGGVFYGGLIGGFLAVVIVVHLQAAFLETADAFAPAVALGQAFGRQGCFAAGCCWGDACPYPFGVHFTEAGNQYTGVPIYGPDGGPLYLWPTQLIESFTMFAVFGLLVWLHRRKKFDGQILIAYGIIYSIFRFSIEFVRDDPRGDLFGLTTLTGLSTSQIVSLVVATASIVFMVWRLKAKHDL